MASKAVTECMITVPVYLKAVGFVWMQAWQVRISHRNAGQRSIELVVGVRVAGAVEF